MVAKMSFQEKSIWISLGLTLLIFGSYFSTAFTVFQDPEVSNSTLTGLFIGAIILVVIIQIVLQSALAIAHRKEAGIGNDERDNLIELKATRISHFILVFGVWATGLAMFLLLSPVVMANIIMFFFILSEIVSYCMRLIYYRRGI